jgi:hypothetical protein
MQQHHVLFPIRPYEAWQTGDQAPVGGLDETSALFITRGDRGQKLATPPIRSTNVCFEF